MLAVLSDDCEFLASVRDWLRDFNSGEWAIAQGLDSVPHYRPGIPGFEFGGDDWKTSQSVCELVLYFRHESGETVTVFIDSSSEYISTSGRSRSELRRAKRAGRNPARTAALIADELIEVLDTWDPESGTEVWL